MFVCLLNYESAGKKCSGAALGFPCAACTALLLLSKQEQTQLWAAQQSIISPHCNVYDMSKSKHNMQMFHQTKAELTLCEKFKSAAS